MRQQLAGCFLRLRVFPLLIKTQKEKKTVWFLNKRAWKATPAERDEERGADEAMINWATSH